MTIRSMRGEDTREASRILMTSFPTSMRAYLPLAQRGCARYLKASLHFPPEATPRRAFVATSDEGRVIGYAEFSKDSIDTAFLSYVCVAEEARGQGVAGALICHAVEQLKISRLGLDVFDDNAGAIRLYGQLGFSQLPGARFWVRRAMPPPGQKAPMVLQPHVALAAHAAYGFSHLDVEFSGERTTVGLVGDSVLRVPDAAMMKDTAALSALRRLLPDRTEAISILDSDAGFDDVIVRSIRMSAERSDILASARGAR